MTFHEKKRPYIILKWAQTLGGFIAPDKNIRKSKPEPYWISNAYSRQLVHQWRAEEQSILVGTTTVLEDNPKLDVRHWEGANPIRIVLDPSLKITQEFHVLNAQTRTLVLTRIQDKSKYIKGIEYERVDFSQDVASQICDILYSKEILSVLIEGGSKTLQTFIEANLWDEASIFTGCTSFETGIKAPLLHSDSSQTQNVGGDTLKFYRND